MRRLGKSRWKDNERGKELKMTHEEKKVGKIVEELTMFFFSVGADDIKTEIKRQANQVVILFESNYQQEFQYNLHRMKEYLNEPRNEGMEDIYWELAGSGDPGETSQLLLVGMMLDKAEVEITEERVRLVLYKPMAE